VKIVKDKALLRNLIHAASSAMQQAYEQDAPAEEIIDSAESAIFQIAEKRIGQGFLGIPEIVKGSFGSIDKLYEQGQRITGLETHFEDFDNLTSGLQKSDLVIVAARPSMGKTAFAINIAENSSVRDHKVVGVFSLEMSQGRLDLIIVDYLQLASAAPPGGGKRYENRTQEVSAISRGLKALAKEMRCPVIALSQLSRAPETRTGNNRPQLADLRESGAIEQDADVVAFIFREEVYKQDDPDLEGKAELIIAKPRNGPTGTVHLAFIKR